jgi:hypothetical protein
MQTHTHQRRGKLGPGAKTLSYGDVVGKQLCFVCFHTGFVGFQAKKDGIVFGKAQVRPWQALLAQA